MARVVVVGAGLAGLAVAARLVRSGHDVTVLERSDRVGGQAGRYAREGFVLDTGPGYLTLPAVYRDVFRKTGRALERELTLVPLDPARRFLYPDGSVLDLPNASRGGTTRALDDALGAGAGLRWDGLVRRGGRMWAALGRTLQEARPDSAVASVRRWGLAGVRDLAPGRSLHRLGVRTLRDPRLVDVLDSYAWALGTDPRDAPAALAILPYLEQTFGVWTVEGGLYRLVEALAERVGGSRQRTGVEVAEVIVEGGRVRGVRTTDGERVAADVVVTQAGAPPPTHPAPGGRPTREQHGHQWHITLLALTRRTDQLADVTTLVSSSARALTVVRGTAPAGHEALAVSGGEHAERAVEELQRRGLDVRRRLLWHDTVSTPGDPPVHGLRGLVARAANQSATPGLFHVGAGGHPGPGVPFAGLSAAIVATLIGRA